MLPEGDATQGWCSLRVLLQCSLRVLLPHPEGDAPWGWWPFLHAGEPAVGRVTSLYKNNLSSMIRRLNVDDKRGVGLCWLWSITQPFSIRRVYRFIRGHTKLVFRDYNILTVYNIYNYMTLLIIDKLSKLQELQYLYEILQLNKPNHSRNIASQ
jgi:hypothetical protein